MRFSSAAAFFRYFSVTRDKLKLNGGVLTGADKQVMYQAILQRDPVKLESTSEDTVEFYTGPNTARSTSFYIRYSDDRPPKDIGLGKLRDAYDASSGKFRPKKDTRKNQKKAFRNEILPQILAFGAKKHKKTGQEVDHADPCFAVLLDNFLWQHHPTPVVLVPPPEGDGAAWTFLDRGLAKTWQDYHRHHARLQLLDAAENREKAVEDKRAQKSNRSRLEALGPYVEPSTKQRRACDEDEHKFHMTQQMHVEPYDDYCTRRLREANEYREPAALLAYLKRRAKDEQDPGSERRDEERDVQEAPPKRQAIQATDEPEPPSDSVPAAITAAAPEGRVRS